MMDNIGFITVSSEIALMLRMVGAGLVGFKVLPVMFEEMFVPNGVGRLRRLLFYLGCIFVAFSMPAIAFDACVAAPNCNAMQNGLVGINMISNGISYLALGIVLYLIYRRPNK